MYTLPKKPLPEVLSETQKVYNRSVGLWKDEEVLADLELENPYFGTDLGVHLFRSATSLEVYIDHWNLVHSSLPFYANIVKFFSKETYDTLCADARDHLGREILALAQEYESDAEYCALEQPVIHLAFLMRRPEDRYRTSVDIDLWNRCGRKVMADFLRDLHSYKP